MLTQTKSNPRSPPRPRRTQRTHSSQLALTFRSWGGRREGAGRKPGPGKRPAPHRCRPEHHRRYPAHVTLTVADDLPNLRGRESIRTIEDALRGGRERLGLRLVHYCVQKNHLHLIVEADDTRALSRGVRGLTIRLAKALNRLHQRTGVVFPERYHARALRTPTEVRHALSYVLCNARKHMPRLHRCRIWTDPCSSADYFHGFLGLRPRTLELDRFGRPPPVTAATCWLLTRGWKYLGLLDPASTPGRRRQARRRGCA